MYHTNGQKSSFIFTFFHLFDDKLAMYFLCFVYVNHMYILRYKTRKVKKNFQLFYCTILLRGPPLPARKLLTVKVLRRPYPRQSGVSCLL